MSSQRPLLVVLTDRFPPREQIIGGGQVRQAELVDVATAAGWRVVILATRERGPARTLPGDAVVQPALARPRPHWLEELLRPMMTWRRLARLLDQGGTLYLGTPRAVEVRRRVPVNLWSRLWEQAWLALSAARKDVRLWVNVHDDWTRYRYSRTVTRNMGLRSDGHLATLLRTWFAYLQMALDVRAADIVSMPSEEFRRRHKTNFPTAEMVVWRAGVRPELGRMGSERPSRGKSLWRIGYTGSPHDADLDLIVEAVRLSRHRDSICVVVGTSLELPARLSDQREVRIEVDTDTRYADFERFAAGVDVWLVPNSGQPYLQEAWPLKIPMYMATGQPVIITRSRELAHTGLESFLEVTGTTAVEIARTIDALLDDPEPAARRARAGRARVLAEGTWSDVTLPILRAVRA